VRQVAGQGAAGTSHRHLAVLDDDGHWRAKRKGQAAGNRQQQQSDGSASAQRTGTGRAHRGSRRGEARRARSGRRHAYRTAALAQPSSAAACTASCRRREQQQRQATEPGGGNSSERGADGGRTSLRDIDGLDSVDLTHVVCVIAQGRLGTTICPPFPCLAFPSSFFSLAPSPRPWRRVSHLRPRLRASRWNTQGGQQQDGV
jgi:hypothetical protein